MEEQGYLFTAIDVRVLADGVTLTLSYNSTKCGTPFARVYGEACFVLGESVWGAGDDFDTARMNAWAAMCAIAHEPRASLAFTVREQVKKSKRYP